MDYKKKYQDNPNFWYEVGWDTHFFEFYQLRYFMLVGDKEGIVVQIETILEQSKLFIRNKKSYAHIYDSSAQRLIAAAYFVLEDYEQVLERCDHLNQQSTGIQRVFRYELYTLRMFCYFEKGQYRLVESSIQAFYSWLHSQSRLGETEKLIFKLLRDLIIAQSDWERNKILTQAQANLTQNWTSNYLYDFFDILNWVQSKIDGVSILKTKQEAANND
ncbi:MAG: hypothetical protein GY810_12595 [Aureispira sp.]|nr:hypothetical protein [Aureispira sp.]